MAAPDVVWKGGRFGQTSRRDPWWISPSAVLVGLSAFLVYSTWAAWQGNHYTFGPYISPFYSPELFGSSPPVARLRLPMAGEHNALNATAAAALAAHDARGSRHRAQPA